MTFDAFLCGYGMLFTWLGGALVFVAWLVNDAPAFTGRGWLAALLFVVGIGSCGLSEGQDTACQREARE